MPGSVDLGDTRNIAYPFSFAFGKIGVTLANEGRTFVPPGGRGEKNRRDSALTRAKLVAK